MAQIYVDTARIELVLSLMRASAPHDVVETIDWLETTGWQSRAVWGGPPDWEGNASLAVEFSKDDGGITLARDRGQWMMEIRPTGWKIGVDLSIIQDAIAGRTDWPAAHSGPLSDQLPQGVAWRETLPAALEWLIESPDREQLLLQLRRRRSRSLFPSGKRAAK